MERVEQRSQEFDRWLNWTSRVMRILEKSILHRKELTKSEQGLLDVFEKGGGPWTRA